MQSFDSKNQCLHEMDTTRSDRVIQKRSDPNPIRPVPLSEERQGVVRCRGKADIEYRSSLSKQLETLLDTSTPKHEVSCRVLSFCPFASVSRLAEVNTKRVSYSSH
jgi:hypothetical protein